MMRPAAVYEKIIIKNDQRSRLTAFYKYHTRLFWLCISANIQWPHLIFPTHGVLLNTDAMGEDTSASLYTLCQMKTGSEEIL